MSVREEWEGELERWRAVRGRGQGGEGADGGMRGGVSSGEGVGEGRVGGEMDMGERKRAASGVGGSGTGLSDETLACVLKYVESAHDRAAVSRVCQQWRRVDGATRKFVTIAYMYSTSPEALTRRFSRLEGVKIKGKPRAAEYDLLVLNWGGYAQPWIRELGRAYPGLQTLQLRRCQVSDADLALVASSPFHAVLQVLHLHKCAGFSTAGLLPVATFCRSLKTLSVEDSDVADDGGAWLNALAVHNSGVLEVLNFAVLGLEDVEVADLAFLVEKCKALVSLKVGEIEMVDMVGAIRRGSALRELGAGSCSYLGDEDSRSYVPISLPPNLTALSGMWAMGDSGLSMILPIAPNLKKLDLKFTLLSRKAYCQVFSLCHALEELQIRNGVGDEGMEVLGKTCRSLRRLRVEHDDAGTITQRGVVAVAQGCGQLQQLVLYVSDITNAALAMVGHGCEHLTDFRLVLEPTANRIVDLPLDDGIKLLLRGCRNLSKMAVYLRHGGLTDRGMGYIGEYGHNLKWLLLGCTGETDVGLVNLSYKAQRLQRLEIRDCPFGEAGLAAAVVSMSSLKFLWVQGYRAVEAGKHLLALSRPYLNLEISLASPTQPGQLIVHYATVGPRSDYPSEVRVLVPNPDDLLPEDMLPPELYSAGTTNG